MILTINTNITLNMTSILPQLEGWGSSLGFGTLLGVPLLLEDDSSSDLEHALSLRILLTGPVALLQVYSAHSPVLISHSVASIHACSFVTAVEYFLECLTCFVSVGHNRKLGLCHQTWAAPNRKDDFVVFLQVKSSKEHWYQSNQIENNLSWSQCTLSSSNMTLFFFPLHFFFTIFFCAGCNNHLLFAEDEIHLKKESVCQSVLWVGSFVVFLINNFMCCCTLLIREYQIVLSIKRESIILHLGCSL